MTFMNAFFTEMVLPFLLIFLIVFAILQKSKILGDGKHQLDAMVALVVGLITITFAYQTGIITKLMGWLALGIAVIFVFLVLYGFVAGDLSGKETPKWMKNTFATLAGIFTIGVVAYVTGGFEWIKSQMNSFGEGAFMQVFVFVLIAGLVLLVVLNSGKKKKKKKDDDD
jgi:lysylphosphatidylglycerol synthetase-like protein (DUF2156 family)